MYWQYRELFNEQGRYFDGTVVHHDQSFLLIVPTIAFVVAALVLGRYWCIHRQSKSKLTAHEANNA
jgi:hypothetical protein